MIPGRGRWTNGGEFVCRVTIYQIMFKFLSTNEFKKRYYVLRNALLMMMSKLFISPHLDVFDSLVALCMLRVCIIIIGLLECRIYLD